MADYHERLVASFGECECPDPPAFFERAAGKESCAFFWKGREDDAVWMGFGAARSLTSLTECETALRQIRFESEPLFPPRGFCAVPFEQEFASPVPWESFPPRVFVLPRLTVRVKDGMAALLGLNCRPDEFLQPSPVSSDAKPADDPLRTVARTQKGEWQRLVADALAEMNEGRLRKIVLARTASAFSDTPIRPAPVLAGLLRQEGCAVFAVGFGADLHLGASPERLFHLDHGQIISESLAGTCPRGRTAREDQKFAHELLQSEKERREHEVVREFIASHLKKLCTTIVAGEPAVRRLATVQHISTDIRGTLRKGVSPDHVLHALHPTPAVCGDPRDAARRFLRREATARGYYAGAVGYVEADCAELAVGIRSALVKGCRAIVFAGAGIVPGSSADHEWDETEHKMQPMLAALAGKSA